MHALLQSIYVTDDPSAVADLPIADHVAVAVTRSKVLPLALLLCRLPGGSGVVAAAQARLASQPVLRMLVETLLL